MPADVNGLVAMPEFGVICLSVLGGQLLFYDTSSGQFKLCLIVDLCGCTIVTYLAHGYAFCERQKIGSSKIAVGDQGGTVNVLEFISSDKWNPFKDKSGDADETPKYYFERLADQTPTAPTVAKPPSAKRPPSIRAYPYHKLHNDSPVEQIVFFNAGRSFASVSLSNHMAMAQCHMINQPDHCELRGTSPTPSAGDPSVRYTANPTGFACVCAAGDAQLATGSADRTVRLWNVASDRPPGPVDCTTLLGHGWGVKRVSHNTVNGHLYSVSTDAVVKVWDVRRGTCLLTFDGLTVAAEPNNSQLWPFAVMHFNWSEQTIVCVTNDYGSFMTVECTKPTVTDQNVSRLYDDKSHETPVVKTLYNALYRVLISASAADSSISVWNLRTGQVIIKWSMAHTEEVYCEVLPVEITAANFDPSGGLLVTGAVNGSVHMWDPNTGVCLNRLRIPSGDRISEVFWLPNKVRYIVIMICTVIAI